MIYLLLGLLPIITYAGSSSSKSYKYSVKVMYAEDLPDEDPDAFSWFNDKWENKNDPYVQVWGVGTGGDTKEKVEQTKILEGEDEPEWNEEFTFDDDDTNGPYTHFFFKIYDDDSTFDLDWNKEDFLGETREVKVSEITDCTDYFEFRLEVTRDGKGCGLLVVEISKTGCDGSESSESSSSGGYEKEEEEKEEEEEEEETKGKGGGGGGSGKTKRRLIGN